MITKNDCYLLLSSLDCSKEELNEPIKQLTASKDIPLNVLKFINDRRQIDVSAFYEYLRKSYNNKKSKLYINIVKEIEEPQEVLTTLSAMLTQILLYSRKIDNKAQFLRHVRADEIAKVLENYFNTADIIPCLKLLKLIKIDLKSLESIK